MLRCLEALNRNFPAARFWDVGLCVSLHDTYPPRDCVKTLRTRPVMVTEALRVRPHCGVTNIQLLRHQNQRLYCHAERLHCGWLEPVSLPPLHLWMQGMFKRWRCFIALFNTCKTNMFPSIRHACFKLWCVLRVASNVLLSGEVDFYTGDYSWNVLRRSNGKLQFLLLKKYPSNINCIFQREVVK